MVRPQAHNHTKLSPIIRQQHFISITCNGTLGPEVVQNFETQNTLIEHTPAIFKLYNQIR